jgi:hypothetical protein
MLAQELQRFFHMRPNGREHGLPNFAADFLLPSHQTHEHLHQQRSQTHLVAELFRIELMDDLMKGGAEESSQSGRRPHEAAGQTLPRGKAAQNVRSAKRRTQRPCRSRSANSTA